MFYIIIIIGLILDFITKYLAVIYLEKQISVIGDFLYLQLVYNPGIAFSIEVNSFLLKLGTLALIIGFFYYYRIKLEEEKQKNQQGNFSHLSINYLNKKYLDASFGLILAGSIGNGFERIFNERVIDFVGVKYFSVFNLADSFITIGAIILIFYYYKTK